MTEWLPLVAAEEEPPPEGPLRDPAWPLFEVGRNPDHLIVYAEIDEDGQPQLLSALPDIGRRQNRCTWLEWEIEGECGSLAGLMRLGLEDTGAYFSEEDWIWWCLREGYCPGQVLIIELVAHYSKYYCYEYACYEYDFSLSWEILGAEHVPMKEHAERWVEAFEGYDKQWVSQGATPILMEVEN